MLSLKCKIIILSCVLYGCETWSFTLREGHRVLGIIFGPKRGEVIEEWRSLIICAHDQISLGKSSQGE
jgi:hypothetical protein